MEIVISSPGRIVRTGEMREAFQKHHAMVLERTLFQPNPRLGLAVASTIFLRTYEDVVRKRDWNGKT